jgi:hypothetical protein
MRVHFPHLIAPVLRSVVLVIPLLACGLPCAARAQAENKTAQQVSLVPITLAIFSHRPLPDGLWPALVAALRGELASGSPETSLLLGESAGPVKGTDAFSQVQIVRGDMIGPDGLAVDQAVTVYIQGECKIIPRGRSIPFDDSAALVSGPLGWVRSEHGHIESFAHVDCDRLAEMLAAQAFGLNREQRNRMMAGAITRVILHEWIHIATQNPRHAERGIARSGFGVSDLLAHPAQSSAQQETRPHGRHEDGGSASSAPATDKSQKQLRLQSGGQ